MTTQDAQTDQRMAALKRANEVRGYRARVRARWNSAGEDHSLAVAARVVRQTAWWSRSWNVYDMLRSVPKIGVHTAHNIMHRARVSESTTVGSLTERQRVALAQELHERREARCGG